MSSPHLLDGLCPHSSPLTSEWIYTKTRCLNNESNESWNDRLYIVITFYMKVSFGIRKQTKKKIYIFCGKAKLNYYHEFVYRPVYSWRHQNVCTHLSNGSGVISHTSGRAAMVQHWKTNFLPAIICLVVVYYGCQNRNDTKGLKFYRILTGSLFSKEPVMSVAASYQTYRLDWG